MLKNSLFLMTLCVFYTGIQYFSESLATDEIPEKSVDIKYRKAGRFSQQKPSIKMTLNQLIRVLHQYNGKPNVNKFLDIDNDPQYISEKLIELSPSLSFFHQNGILDELFHNNLNEIAEKICLKIKEQDTLPQKFDLFLEIYHGNHPNINPSHYTPDDLQLAYKVANNAQNLEMVNKLYVLVPQIKKATEELKKNNPEIYSSQDYIHEPYWNYNLVHLHEYGLRIIDKIKDIFIHESSITEEQNGIFINSNNQKIRIRQVKFGYVLPNLYLKKHLEAKMDQKRAVPKIFIIPLQQNVKFKFKLPYFSYDKQLDNSDKANNPLGVICKDFIVYQEFIEGDGEEDDRSFADLGHRDFNAVQIITSSRDGKKYLVDTKEEKNFFLPFVDIFYDSYIYLPIEYNIFDKDNCEIWKKNNQDIMYKAKNLHFEPRKYNVKVTVNL